MMGKKIMKDQIEFHNTFVFISTAVCTYNGVAFRQGATWNDGCDLVCVCEDGMTGFYRCNDRLVS